MTAGGIHGLTTSMTTTGRTAEDVGTGIETLYRKAESEAANLSGQWVGDAKTRFDIVFKGWQEDGRRVVQAFTELGGNVQFAARTYGQHDVDSAGAFSGLTSI